MGGLIVASEALASGDVTRQELRKYYVKVFHNVHLRRGVELTAALRAEAAFLWSGRKAVVSGVSAAALHGNQWISAERPRSLSAYDTIRRRESSATTTGCCPANR